MNKGPNASCGLDSETVLNTRNPLLLPEIAQQIASLSGYRGQRDLAYTCRQLFDSIIPIIWRKIDGVKVLMKLIPGVQITERPIPDGSGNNGVAKRTVILDESSLDDDWHRYWLYAPFVQHLDVFSEREELRVNGWHFLRLKLNGGTLLPNLRSLNVDLLGYYPTPYFDRQAWFRLLLSPSLQEVHLGGDQGDVEHPRACSLWLLLNAISSSAPRNLVHTPLTRDGWHPSEYKLALLCPNEYQQVLHWLNDIQPPINLRYLQITIFSSPRVAWDELYTLGCLPLLEELKIYYSPLSYQDQFRLDLELFPSISFPSNLFPSLRRLHLGGGRGVRWFGWMWGLKPMVSRLSSAHVEVDPSYFSPEGLGFVADIVRVMHNGSPSLSDLSIYLEDMKEMGLLGAVWELLFAIPLNTLVLNSWKNISEDHLVIHSQRTFPHLRRLQLLPSFPLRVWVTIIPKIAKAFPNLEHLCIRPFAFVGVHVPLDVNRVGHVSFQSIDIHMQEDLLDRDSGKRSEQRRGAIKWVLWPVVCAFPVSQ